MQSVKVDRLLRSGVVLLAAGLVFTIYASIHQRVVVAGDTAPDFTVTADNGQTVSVPHFAGKLLLLNFWASWCAPCVQETPSLSQLAAQYKDKGLVVLALSVDKEAAAYQAFLQKYHPAFLTARDAKVDGSLHETFGTFMYPETYLIDAQGKVVKKIAEGADWNDPSIRQYIASLL